MMPYPSPAEVFDELGDKVVSGLAAAVRAAADDLAEYRQIAPQFVSRHSPRGLANWLHDQAWAHVADELDEVTNVHLVDVGVTREVHVGLGYRIRIKKHSSTGGVRAYPTQTTMRFIYQEPDLLTELGIRRVNLCVGYEWDAETREIVGPVMSLRDGSFDEVIWMVDLPSAGSSGLDMPTPLPAADGPTPPVIDTTDTGTTEEGISTS